MVKKIYIASPFFCDEETEALSKVEKILKGRGFDVFSPREHQFGKDNMEKHEWSKATFNSDKNAIDRCDVVVMLYFGNYSDSGTAWECGYAYGTGKNVVVVQLGESSNLMVHEGCLANLMSIKELEEYDFDKMIGKAFSGKMF